MFVCLLEKVNGSHNRKFMSNWSQNVAETAYS